VLVVRVDLQQLPDLAVALVAQEVILLETLW
jgi:hypothetical protein